MKSPQNAAFARRMRMRAQGSVLVFAASMLSLAATANAFGQTAETSQTTSQTAQPPQGPRQGKLYSPVPPAASNLAQIVMFRDASRQTSGRKAAHVYVNGELEGALMPSGYTRFCVARGTYSIEAYIGDEPLYAGKANPKTEIDVEGGKTYFVGVSENGTGEPVPYRRVDAERLLKGSRDQIDIINRASAVVPCGNQPDKVAPPPVQSLLKFQLDAAVLFDFAKADSSAITPAGRRELEKIAAKIRALPADSVTRVDVRGHADPIGSESFNVKLSKARAQTVSQVLSQAGIPSELIYAEGLGSTQLTVHCLQTGNLPKRIRCNAPNRRVEVNVQGVRPESEASN